MKKNKILEIKNLQVQVDNKTIISTLDLMINPGEIHVIMGPNGSGKSTLAYTLARHPNYIATQGSIDFLGEDLLQLSPEEAACKGLFLSFQYPVAIPGVSNMQFLKSSLNAIRKSKGLAPIDAIDFLNLVKTNMQALGIAETMLQRSINEGFSGGEKKRNEILQMLLLQPKLAILDEIDSGLDIDALKTVATGINTFKGTEQSILIITHYQRLLEYITPDFVHILAHGKLVHSGGKTLPLELEQKGYAWLTTEGA
jgi:Fe-S cluster assembly ATP-binding protein